jgi:aspartyl/asparaginyl beta-hydroxylase (cupin superfamily)
MTNLASVALLLSLGSLILFSSHGFAFRHVSTQRSPFFQPLGTALAAKKGFDNAGGGGFGSKPNKAAKKKRKGGLKDTLDDKLSAKKKSSPNMPFVKSEQDDLIESLAAASSKTCVGQVVANSPLAGTPDANPFWELMPSLISSRFPHVRDEQLQRVAGFVRHTLDPNLPLEDEIISNPHRPQDEIHAYMPGLGPTEPFHDPNQLELCKLMSENYETIKAEYDALLRDIENGGKDRFQSVTSMNYQSGWKTLVLFYNGHRIPDFPYHLCPTTARILETVPLAGRIAGFNRQQPQSGIPLHTDGNNMWLTCQMGIYIPEGQSAYIRVGPETRRWGNGECLLYDTTYEHETFNEHESQERVVLHVDFFNTLAMTPIEIEVMQYIYRLREEFMKAEGVSKVGAQIL